MIQQGASANEQNRKYPWSTFHRCFYVFWWKWRSLVAWQLLDINWHILMWSFWTHQYSN